MGMSRNEFKKDINRGGSFTDWRKDGKCIFYIHPKSDIEKRSSVSLRIVIESDDGVEEIRWVRRLVRGDKDPVALLKMWLEEDKEHDLDTVILRAQTKGGDVEEWLKGDLLAHKDYDWRKNLLRTKIEYFYCIANVTKKGEPPTGPEILVVPFSGAKKLNKVWDGEIEDLGDQDGDPWQSPYPCKVTYDGAETGSNMYDANTVNIKAYPVTSEVSKLLYETEPEDMSQHVDPAREDVSWGTSAEILRKLLVVPCPVLDVDVATEAPEEPAKPKRRRPKGSKNKAKPAAEKPAPAPVEAKPTPKPPSKPTPKPPSKPTVKPESESSIVAVENAIPGVTYEYDEEPVKFVEWDGEQGIAEDDDGDPIEIPAGSQLKKLNGESVPEQAPDTESMFAKDCAKGESYYLHDGRKVTFKRYKKSKDEAVFTDEQNNRVFVKNASEEVVSHDAEVEPDPPEPQAGKEEVEQTVPESKPDPEPEEQASLACPTCETALVKVGDGEYRCEKCGVTFEVDDGSSEEEPPAF